jgi:hypothetical protein
MHYDMDLDELLEFISETPAVEGYDCVEFTRKTRDRHYKEDNGIPCEEEKEYLTSMKRKVDDHYDAYYKIWRETHKKSA